MIRAALLCGVLFAALTVAIAVGATAWLDVPVADAAVAAASAHPGPTRLAQVVEAVTQPGWVYLAGLLATGLAWSRGRRPRARAALVAGVVAWLTSPALKAVVGRERPALDAGLTSAGGGSFPSGHALASATVVLTVALVLTARTRRWLVLVPGLLGCLLVAVDRVWLGAHWPTDVLGSWLLAGVLVTAAIWWVDRSERDGDHAGAARTRPVEGGR